MDFETARHWLALVLALAFAIGGLVNIVGPAAIRQAYRNWGYPEGFNIVAGLLDIVAAALLMWGPMRTYGAALASMITFAAFATLALHGEWRKIAPSIALIVVLATLLI